MTKQTSTRYVNHPIILSVYRDECKNIGMSVTLNANAISNAKMKDKQLLHPARNSDYVSLVNLQVGLRFILGLTVLKKCTLRSSTPCIKLYLPLYLTLLLYLSFHKSRSILMSY